MLQQNIHNVKRHQDLDFFNYWESLGFFDNIQSVLPSNFFILFEIARILFSEETKDEAYNAIEDLATEEQVLEANRDENIQINRLEKIAPVSDRMEIDTYRKINELKKALPRELALDDEVFNIKLFTKSLIVQKFYESEADSFKPVSTSRNDKGKDANRFEQKFYLLLDRSKSMELKMRDFYSKCIVAEFLRRKIQSKAKIFYRPFDSKTGKLFRLEKLQDFPVLIERVLLTTTGGKSTNIETAINQAISDIHFDKEMMKTEILVVTDGISKINKEALKEKLGDIKLNILKIGDEVAEPDYFELEENLKNENVSFNPTALNIKQIQDELKKARDGAETSNLSMSDRRAYQVIKDLSDNMFKDLKELADKYIEIKDFNVKSVFDLEDEKLDYIKKSVEQFENEDVAGLEIDEKTRLYKKLHFLGQYVKMLLQNGNNADSALVSCDKRIAAIKQKMLKDPELLFTFVKTDGLGEDKKLQKLAKKELKEVMKNLQMDEKSLTFKDMKKAQMTFTMDAGKGSSGQLFMLLFALLYKALKTILTLPARPFMEKKKNGKE